MITIALANEKGGSAKSTTAVNLSAALAEQDRDVLLLDMDSQQDALAFADNTSHLFQTQAADPRSLKRIATNGREHDFLLIDCPPSLGKEVAAALQFADLVIVPVNSEYSAVRGLGRLTETMDAARAAGNSTLRHKVLLTMFDTRAGHCHAIKEFASRSFGDALLQTEIRRSYAFADAALEHKTIFEHSPRSGGASAYRALAREVLALCIASPAGLLK